MLLLSSILEKEMSTTTALISGASSGFGQAIAERYSELGFQLILVARREQRLQKLVQKLSVPCHIICMDIRDKQKVFEQIDNIPKPFKNIDILVNNAGLALGLEPAQSANLDDWETMIDTNIKGLTYLTRSILPSMIKNGQGHIVNMGSIAGNWPYPGANTYGASKAFVKQFSLNLRADLQGTGVRVTNIEPGLSETEFSLVRFKGDAEKARAVYQKVKPLIAEDIAESVVWATSLPAHVNINSIEIMPTAQAFGPLAVDKK